MNKIQIKQKIADLKAGLGNPNVPDNLQSKMKSKIIELEAMLKPDESKKTDNTKAKNSSPKNLSQFKKWIQANKGESMFLKVIQGDEFTIEPRKINTVQTNAIGFMTPGGKESWIEYGPAKNWNFTDDYAENTLNPNRVLQYYYSEPLDVEQSTTTKKPNTSIDLFEDYDNQPKEVQKILEDYSTDFENGDFSGLKKARTQLEKIGYTFDFDMDGTSYDLRELKSKQATKDVTSKNTKKSSGKYARKADDTGNGINEGYVFQDGEMHFETQKGLLKHLKTLDWENSSGELSSEITDDDELLDWFYNEDAYYQTEWDIDSEIADNEYYYTKEGVEMILNEDGSYSSEDKDPLNDPELIFDEELGGNFFYTYKGKQIMYSPKIDGYTEKDLFFFNDKEYITLNDAKKAIDKTSDNIPNSKYEIGDLVVLLNKIYKIEDKAYRNNIDGKLTWVYSIPKYSDVLVSESNLKPHSKKDMVKILSNYGFDEKHPLMILDQDSAQFKSAYLEFLDEVEEYGDKKPGVWELLSEDEGKKEKEDNRFTSAQVISLIPIFQQKVLSKMAQEDKKEIIENLQNNLSEIPKIYGQDGKGKESIVYLHYFNSSSDYYVTELTYEEDEKLFTAFGYVILNGDMQNAEFGYLPINEIIQQKNPIRYPELDFYWKPTSLKSILDIKQTPKKEQIELEKIDLSKLPMYESSQEALKNHRATLVWSEGFGEEHIGIDDFKTLDAVLKTAGFTDTPRMTYIKNKLSFINNNEPYIVRIDNSLLDHDFNPEKDSVLAYLKKNHGNIDWDNYFKESPAKEEKPQDWKSMLKESFKSETISFVSKGHKLNSAQILAICSIINSKELDESGPETKYLTSLLEEDKSEKLSKESMSFYIKFVAPKSDKPGKTKYFESFEEAKEWGLKNISNFSAEFIETQPKSEPKNTSSKKIPKKTTAKKLVKQGVSKSASQKTEKKPLKSLRFATFLSKFGEKITGKKITLRNFNDQKSEMQDALRKSFEEVRKSGAFGPVVVTQKTEQTGNTNKSADAKREALPPGKRISKDGNIYYEGRANRSDVEGSNT